MSGVSQLTVTQPGKLDVEEIGSFLEPMKHAIGQRRQVYANLQTCQVSSALQPILSLTHQRTVGFEALARAWDYKGKQLSPLHLFNLPQSDPEHVLLDRLCRYLHLLNFINTNDKTNWLFLNISPSAVSRGGNFDAFFGQLLTKLHFPANRIVTEIVEDASSDESELAAAVNYYKSLGCLTAIDDFGAGHSNFERIWNLSPDIVKLDRSIIVRAAEDKKARFLLNGMVSLLHQAECMVLLEGVETFDQSLIALDSGVDFVQGYYFAKPGAVDHEKQCSDKLHKLSAENKKQFYLRKNPTSQIQHNFSGLFDTAIAKINDDRPLAEACADIMQQPTIEKVYLINEQGHQVGNSINKNQPCPQSKYRPLADTTTVDWFRRDYLRRAINNPGVLQVSRPYLSLTGSKMCVTLSQMFFGKNERLILCADIDSRRPSQR